MPPKRSRSSSPSPSNKRRASPTRGSNGHSSAMSSAARTAPQIAPLSVWDENTPSLFDVNPNDPSFDFKALQKVSSFKPKSAKRLAEEAAGEGAPVRVYADGIFDMFHYGHARALEQAKKLFPNATLVVGVCGDEITRKMKGKTVQDETQRAESVRHCRWVDEVVGHAPWTITPEFIEAYQIDYVSHGDDLSVDEHGDVYAWLKRTKKFKVFRRTEGISTSDLIFTIIHDYDAFVARNLARGYTPKQLNIGFLKANELKVKQSVEAAGHWLSDHITHPIVEFLRGFNENLFKGKDATDTEQK